MRRTPRWGALPWFVLVLTILVVMLVVVLPPLILDKTPPAWVLLGAARVSNWHGDPDPVEAEWLQTTRAEAARLMEPREPGLAPEPSPSGASATAVPTPTALPSSQPSPIEQPERSVELVVMRGRFDSAPPGGPPPLDAPERWLVVAYDTATRERWRLAVLSTAPELPDEAVVFEL